MLNSRLNDTMDSVRVVIGDYDRTKNDSKEQSFEIDQIIVHEEWTSIYDPDGKSRFHVLVFSVTYFN